MKGAFLAAAIIFLFGLGLDAAEPSALKLVQTIPLPGVTGRFDHFAIDIKGQRLFVAVPDRGPQKAEIRVFEAR